MAAKFDKVKDIPTRRRSAILALRVPTSRDSRTRVRQPTAFEEACKRRQVQEKKIAKEDDLKHYNEFDFCERYRKQHYDDATCKLFFQRARKGEFPPWTPSTARGEPCVCKLAPQTVKAVRSVAEQKCCKKRNKPGSPLEVNARSTKRLRVDGVELLPRDSDNEFAEPREARAASSDAATGVSASRASSAADRRVADGGLATLPALAKTPQAVVPGTRRFPSSFSGSDDGLRMTRDVQAQAPSPAAAKVAGKRQPVQMPTVEELREEMMGFIDSIEDPCDFTRAQQVMDLVATSVLNEFKVKTLKFKLVI